jgi:hypothetical protein
LTHDYSLLITSISPWYPSADVTRQLWFRSGELYKSILKDGAEPEKRVYPDPPCHDRGLSMRRTKLVWAAVLDAPLVYPSLLD